MGRPPTPVGTYGAINLTRLGAKRWEASARFRFASGHTKRVRRTGASQTAATHALKAHMAELAAEVTSGEISTSSRFAFVAGLWLQEIEREARLGDRSPNTVRLYRGYLTNWILPAIGELQMRELRVKNVDDVIKRAHERGSYDTAKSVRAALSGACGYAVRHGALAANPVRSAGRLPRGQQKEVVALDAAQRTDLHAKLRALAVAKATDAQGRSLGRRAQVWADLPDLYEGMLSTGVRIGELLALSGDEVDPARRTVAIDWHLIHVTGQGLVRRHLRKGNVAGLLLAVPEWSVPMWRRRKLSSGGGPLWPAWSGGWSDPSNVIHRIREAMDECGYDWVTSHVFRKTVATVLDEDGLPIGAVADQLGNSRQVAEKRYVAKRVANEASADALGRMLDGS